MAVVTFVAPAGGWPSAMAQTASSAMTSAPPPVGVVGYGYLHLFAASPPQPDTTFTVVAGSLPPGLLLSPVGFLTGAPLAAGTFGPTTVCGARLLAPRACQTFTIVVMKRVPGVLAAPSPGGPVGTPVRETAALVGAVVPTGSVLFRLFSDPACTAQVFSSRNAVTVAAAATSDDFRPAVPGTYRWTVAYSGDANNAPVATPCDASNSVTITGSAPSTTTTSPTSTTTTTTTSTVVATTTTTRLPPVTTTAAPQGWAPTIRVTPAEAAPGHQLAVSGERFPARAELRAELTGGPVLLGTTSADANGAFRMVVTVPGGTPPGRHTVRVSALGGIIRAETTLLVAGASG